MRVEYFEGHGGIRLVADVGGKVDAPPVILLHGGGQTRFSWGKAAKELVEMGFRVISLDLRGHGESDWASDGNYAIDAFIADLKAVISTLDQAPALVGASLGGVTSLIAIGETDALLARALVLVDIVPHADAQGAGHIRDFMMGNLDGFTSVDEAADAVARYLPERPRPTSNEGLLKNLRLAEDGRYYWHWDPAFVGAQRQEMFSRMQAAAEKVRLPTLLVRGMQSRVVTDDGVEQLQRLIPHAELYNVAGAGHMVAGDKNDAFNEGVEAFLRRAVAI